MNKAIDKDKVEMTAEETAFIADFTGRYCRPHNVVMAERIAEFVKARQFANVTGMENRYALAAGRREDAVPAGVKSPEETVRFAFASDCGEDSPDAWRATVTIPPGATADTMLRVSVRSGADKAEEGVFTIAGCALPLMRGEAEITFGLFLAGIRNTSVNLRRPSAQPVAGNLLFF